MNYENRIFQRCLHGIKSKVTTPITYRKLRFPTKLAVVLISEIWLQCICINKVHLVCFLQVSMRLVCQYTNITKASFWLHYNTKRQVNNSNTILRKQCKIEHISQFFITFQCPLTLNSWQCTTYCKFINVWEGFIWRFSRPPLNRKN